jgi:hypothetical protein
MMFERSLQASPIDPSLFDHFSDEDASGFARSEEAPMRPPIETPLMVQAASSRATARILDYRIWMHQLPFDGNKVRVERGINEGVRICCSSGEICISRNGLRIKFQNEEYSFPPSGWPDDLINMYITAQVEIESWRSHVVRLSMESDDVECSLMDDIFPPRTFLVEYKNSVLLRSIKVQNGCVYFQTPARTVSVPVDILEEGYGPSISEVVTNVAPELCVVDIDGLYAELVELRAAVLDEDKRMRTQSAGVCTIGGG